MTKSNLETTKKCAPKLKGILEVEGIRQVELSTNAGVRPETLNRVITGKQKVGRTTQFKILNALNELAKKTEYTLEGVFE